MANKKNKSSRWQKFWKQVKKIAKDHFVPHSGNAHVPHVLHHRALFGYSVLLVVLKVFALVVIISFPSSSVLSSAITPENIIDLTNQTRRSLDLPELKTNTKLMSAAQAKAEDMFLNGYFAHTSPTGVTPWYWFEVNGYDYRSAGENLAAHFHEAEDVSSTHVTLISASALPVASLIITKLLSWCKCLAMKIQQTASLMTNNPARKCQLLS
jgi:hypothetical protein